MTRYFLTPGVRVECLGDTWAAFSPSSGETLLLNAEAAAVLELLAEGEHNGAAIGDLLSRESTTRPVEVERMLDGLWPQLLTAGLVRRALEQRQSDC